MQMGRFQKMMKTVSMKNGMSPESSPNGHTDPQPLCQPSEVRGAGRSRGPGGTLGPTASSLSPLSLFMEKQTSRRRGSTP